MLSSKIALAAALPAAAILLMAISILLYLCKGPLTNCSSRDTSESKKKTTSTKKQQQQKKKTATTYSGLLRLGIRDPVDSSVRQSNRVANVWRTTYPIKSFNWSEHPALIAEAVEHGWATFAFTYTYSASPIPSKLWDMCTGCSHSQAFEPEISWEIGAGTDYMQKLRLNPGLPLRKDNAVAIVQALQTALPVPGPPLGPLSFPQEGYFEVTILAESQEYNADMSQSSFNDNELAKLISRRLSLGKSLSSDMTSTYAKNVYEKGAGMGGGNGVVDKEVGKATENGENNLKLSDEVGKKELLATRPVSPATAAAADQLQLQICAVGLAAGVAPPFRLPGFDPGSVGFLSSGRVFLNGEPHMEESPESPTIAKRMWGLIHTTVGCGFDPAAKKVYFTLNGERVHELTTTSSEFGHPLYPTIAANYDVTLSANFGQTSFEYAPANSQRIPDPCFRRPLPKSTKTGSVYEDSGDLFSMGRIDSQWLAELVSPTSEDLQHPPLSEAESDLFEIVLDSRS